MCKTSKLKTMKYCQNKLKNHISGEMYNVHGLEHSFFKKNMSIHLKFINKFNVITILKIQHTYG